MSTRRWLALITAVVAIVASQPQVLSQQKASPSEKRAGLISELSGRASVRKAPSAPASTVERFAAIADGAVLELGPDSRAVLVLARGRRFELGAQARVNVHADQLGSRSGPVRELPSLPALPPLVALDAKAPKALGGVRLRSTGATGLSPSGSSALAVRTTLRFTPVEGAATYRIEVEDEQGRVVFGVQTTSAEVSIPADVLRPGTSYYWTVRTLDRAGPQARGAAGFTTLRHDEAQAREDLKRQLHEEGGASSLALLAAIDRQLGLYEEALDGFRAALARAPNDEALKDAVNELEEMRRAGGR